MIDPEPENKPESLVLSEGEEAPKAPSIDEANLNMGQQSIVKLMKEHHFKPTNQAPDSDRAMIADLGAATSKKKDSENIWEVEYAHGAKYTGPIVEDPNSTNFEQPLVAGKFWFPNGDQYEGTIGARASGTYTHSNGVVYKGQFFKLAKSGQGTQTFPHGHSYSGMFKNNVYNGKGRFEFANGDVYQGNFKAGRRNNIGTYTFKGGEVAVGDWKDDLLHGKAQYQFNNGQKVKSAFESSTLKL